MHYAGQGMFEKAEQKCKLGMELQKKVYDAKHPFIAYSLKNLCNIYRMQGKHSQAEQTINASLAIMSEYHAEDDRVLASFYVDKAKVFQAMSDTGNAEKYYSKALRQEGKTTSHAGLT